MQHRMSSAIAIAATKPVAQRGTMQSSWIVLWQLVLALVLSHPMVAQRRIDPLVVPPPTSTIEAEALVDSAQASQGRVARQDMQRFGPGWSNNAQLFWGVAQPGAKLRLPLSIAATGRYQVVLHFTRAPDFAIVHASLDGAAPISFNGYAPTVSRDRAVLGVQDLAPGHHELVLEIANKDGSSRGFNVGIDKIDLERAVDRAASEHRPADSPGGAPSAPSAPAVPVITASSIGDEDLRASNQQGIEPLPMPTRIATVQRALATMGTPLGEPSEPIRLTPNSPQVGNRAGVALFGGGFETRSGNALFYVNGSAAVLHLEFDAVNPQRPHLLECGLVLSEEGEVRVTQLVSAPTGDSKVETLATLPFEPGLQRLLLVIIPKQPRLSLSLRPASRPGFAVQYCELTRFK